MCDDSVFDRMLDFLEQLRRRKIFFSLSRERVDAIMVTIVVPGERWEVEYLRDGTVDVEVFRSDGAIRDETSLDRLFREFSD